LIGFYDLPLTYLDDYLKAVSAVTAGQVKDAFQRRIDPEGMVSVVVGAPEKKQQESLKTDRSDAK